MNAGSTARGPVEEGWSLSRMEESLSYPGYALYLPGVWGEGSPRVQLGGTGRDRIQGCLFLPS